ncbi:MAG: phospho-N-acetylmuramoyl-pentapeptide-transferase [Chloroflexota bacterium]|nr:phospho-N-acetylmuramoyl-pentapeptide-transferase [Dehalococcoidia bacterium]MDW8253176.1 phospho-N-acetylmuramoyl-pentapeptide-transferase [Chloroflexota bacterium]
MRADLPLHEATLLEAEQFVPVGDVTALVMAYALTVAALAFLIGLAWGRPLIRFLVRHRIGKQIRLEGPKTHSVKAGTPTMGGLLIFITVFIVTVPLNLIGRLSMLVPLGVLVASGILGAIDDLLNLAGGEKTGLTARFKFVWLLLISVTAALMLHFGLRLDKINIPFVGGYSLGLLYLPIAAFVIMGTSHAVNLTDGLDGLAGGLAAQSFAAYGVIAYLQGQSYLVTFCFTVAGAILAFLWFNAHPAQVFMGDTGSLALGGTLGVVALMTGQWLLLPVVGLPFVVTTLSVIFQVSYFKLTKGKRLFRMAPLHHHFELLGWPETRIVTRYWLVGMLCAMIGIALALTVPS